MRILQITPTFLPNIGGIEFFVYNLSKNLIDNNIISDVLIISNSKKFTERKKTKLIPEYGMYQIKFDRINVYILKYESLFELIFKLRKIQDFINRYNVIHIHDPHLFTISFLFIKLIKGKPKKVLSTHGFFFHTQRLKLFKKVYWETMAKQILRSYDLVIAVSKSDWRRIEKIKMKKKILIENPVEIDKFIPLYDKIDFYCCNFVFWGRIAKNKQLEKAIEVMANLKHNKLVECNLKIIGPIFDKKYFKHLKTLIKTLQIEENVNFVGPLEEQKFFTTIAPIPYLIMPSSYEGFGLSLIEGMAAGKVVIANDIPVFKKVISHNHNGFLIDFSDTKKATEIIYSIINLDIERKKNISREAIKTVKKFSWKEKVREFINAYHQILL